MRNVDESNIKLRLAQGYIFFFHVEIKSPKVTIIYFKAMEIDRILI